MKFFRLSIGSFLFVFLAAFLASSLAAGITGSTVYVDKGYHTMGMAVQQGAGGG